MDFWLDTPVIGSLSNNSSRIGFVIVCRSRRSGVLAGLVADGRVEILIVLGPDLEALATSDSGFAARFTNPLPPPCPGVCAPPTKSFEGANLFGRSDLRAGPPPDAICFLADQIGFSSWPGLTAFVQIHAAQ